MPIPVLMPEEEGQAVSVGPIVSPSAETPSITPAPRFADLGQTLNPNPPDNDDLEGDTGGVELAAPPTPNLPEPTKRPSWRLYISMMALFLLTGGFIVASILLYNRGNSKIDNSQLSGDSDKLLSVGSEQTLGIKGNLAVSQQTTLQDLEVRGNLTLGQGLTLGKDLTVEGNGSFGGNVSATYFIGDGSKLTNLPIPVIPSIPNVPTNVVLLSPASAQTGDIDISGTLVAGGLQGNGSAITSLNATNLSSGTVPDSRLSSNVVLIAANNTFTGTNAFNNVITQNGNIVCDISNNCGFGGGGGNSFVQGGNAFGAAAELGTTDNFALNLSTNGVIRFTLDTSGNSNLTGTATAAAFSGSGAALTTLNASNISSGTVANARLSASVTLQGNSFNAASQLVQLNASTQLPAVSGVNLTNLNATNLASGTVADGRLSSNVPLKNTANTFTALNNFTGGLQNNSNAVCDTSGNCAAAGAAGGDLSGTYPNPSVAKLQGTNITISSLASTNFLQYNGTAWVNQSFSGDVQISNTGVATIQANSVALSTDTVGDYVANLGTLTGLSSSGNTGEGSTPTLSVLYGSGVNTAVQGNLTLTCSAGTGNLSGGGGTITLGSGGSCSNLSISSSPIFATSVTTPLMILTGAGSNGQLQVATLGQTTTYTLPDPGGAAATICLTTGNCAGSGGGVTTAGGTTGVLAKFTGAQALGDSTLSESGSVLTASGTLLVQGSNALTLGTAASNAGAVLFKNGTNTNTVTLQSGVSGSSFSLTLPTTGGSNGDCLQSSGAGVLVFTACTGGAGGGVTSLDSQTGVITLANSSGGGGTVTINDAAADGSTKGIATFNSTNFSASGGVVNTIQGIASTSSPTFAALTLSSALTVANGGTGAGSFTSKGVIYGNGTSALQVTAAGTSGQVLVANGSGVPVFVSLTGDVGIDNAGLTTIQANSVALASDTTGDYVANLGSLTGLSTSANSGEGSTPTLSVLYGATSNTAVQGNTTLICPSASGNASLSGTGNSITLGSGGTCNAISLSSTPSFTSITATGASSATLGVASTTPGSIIFNNDTNSNTITLNTVVAASSSKTISLPNEDGTVCLQSSSNCGFATSSGSGNYIQNQIAGQQPSSNFWISATGRADTSLLTPLLDTPSGTTTLNVGTTNASAGINLNQSTTIASAKNFTVTSGTTSLTGTTNINTSGSAATTIGNSGATVAIASSAFNLTTAGVITGVTGFTEKSSSASAFTLQNSGGTIDLLKFDASAVILKVFDSTGANYASISATTNSATFTSNTGATNVGNGTGDVNVSLSNNSEKFNFLHNVTSGGAASSSDNDFVITRQLVTTNNALAGNVAKIEDLSTFTGGSSAPNLLYINQNNTGATGNLILAQTGGSTTRFSVSTTGATTVAGLLTGSAGATVSGAAISLNASSNFTTNINTGTSSGAVSIGNSLAGAIALQSNSSIGLTGVTNINASANNATNINTGTSTGAVAIGAANASSTLTLEAGTGASAIQIGNGATAHGIQIGSGAAVQTIILGSTNSTSTTAIQGGTGATAVSIGTGASGTINIGNNTNANTIQIGNIAATSATTLGSPVTTSATIIQGGTGASAVSIQAGASGTISIGNGGSAGTINIGNGTAGQTVSIGNPTGGSSSAAITIGTSNTLVTTVTIGSINTNSSVTIQGANGINVGTGNAANTIQIGNIGNAIAQTVNIGNNATASSTDTVTIGNLLSTSSTTVQGGTGASAVSVQAGAAGTISIGTTNSNTIIFGSTGQTGAITLGQSTDTQTINIGTGVTASGKTLTIHIGDNGAASSTTNITVGSAIAGTLTVRSAATFNKALTVGGHIISTNTSGSTTVAANTAVCGTGCTVTISGNDTAGIVTVNTGTGVTAGTLGTITFANAYGVAPMVVLTPETVPAASTFPQYHYASTTTTFDLKAYTALSNSVTYKFSYQIIQ